MAARDPAGRPAGRLPLGEPVVELFPSGLRLMGPDRRETPARRRAREVEARLDRLAMVQVTMEGTLGLRERELELSGCIERGCQCRLDRMERRLAELERRNARLLRELAARRRPAGARPARRARD